MNYRKYQSYLITTSFVTIAITTGFYPAPTLANTNHSKVCDFSNDNWLKERTGYPSKNPERTLYNNLPYRASAGSYIIIMKDGKLCEMIDNGERKNRVRAIKKFSEIYPGTKPIQICDIPQSGEILNCRKK